MKARLLLLVWILGAPILGVLVAQGSTSSMENELDRHTGLAILGYVSIGAIVAGLLVLAAIAVGGYRAQSNRETLLALFKPGLYVVATVVSALIIVHAGILVGVMALSGHTAGGLVIAIVVAAGSGVVAVSRAAFQIVQRAEMSAFGRVLTIDTAGDLWKQTERIAEKLGALRPDNIVVGLDPGFFVTEATIHTPDGSLNGRTLYCSLPWTRILTVDEFSAIIGHELGHFRGADTAWSERFAPIYRGSFDAIVRLQDASSRRGWGAVVLLPAIAMFGFFLERFAIAERLNSRTRELLADRAGAEATSARVMATALVKVHAFAEQWGTTLEAAVQDLQKRTIRKNLSASFADTVAGNATPQSLGGLADTSTSHPTDTHPPLGARLASLEVELDSVATESLAVQPATSAASLIPQADAIEEELSDKFQRLIAQGLGINLNPSAASSLFRTCISCGTKVMPTQDGHCPSCGANMPT